MENKAPSRGQDVHPSPTGGHPGQVGVTPFWHCSQCGWVNDTRTTGYGPGEGLTETTEEHGNPDRDATGGCSLCGSRNWNPTRPPVLPDDRFKPNQDLKHQYRMTR